LRPAPARRVEAAQARAFVVDRRRGLEFERLARRGQARTGLFAGAGHSLRAEEQQVLRQAVRRIGVLTGAQLRQQARGESLAVDICLQQALALRLVDGRGQLPQRGQAVLAAGCQSGEQIAHALRSTGIAPAHQRQRFGFELRLRVGVGAHGWPRIGHLHHTPLPILGHRSAG
jgi:hypothetical protein